VITPPSSHRGLQLFGGGGKPAGRRKAIKFTEITDRRRDSSRVTEHGHLRQRAQSKPLPHFLRLPILQRALQQLLRIFRQLLRPVRFHFVERIDVRVRPSSAPTGRSPLSVAFGFVVGHNPPDANHIVAFFGWVFQQSFDSGVGRDHLRAWNYHAP